MVDIIGIYSMILAEAEAQRIDDEMIRLCPEIDLKRYAELMEMEENMEREKAAHRAICKCPYCEC